MIEQPDAICASPGTSLARLLVYGLYDEHSDMTVKTQCVECGGIIGEQVFSAPDWSALDEGFGRAEGAAGAAAVMTHYAAAHNQN